jgi:hypothetical protein
MRFQLKKLTDTRTHTSSNRTANSILRGIGADDAQIESSANGAAAVFARTPSERDSLQNPVAGHSLHCGLNAPPTASQASIPGVASETQIML